MVGKVRGEEVREGELGSKTWREGGSSNNIIINSTQKVSSRVLNSRNMMSVARTSYCLCLYTIVTYVSNTPPKRHRRHRIEV